MIDDPPRNTVISAPNHHTDESKHVDGPHRLEGWTTSVSIPDLGRDLYPTGLVIARQGKVIRTIQGQPFVWRWIFLSDGTHIAYETGPLHFGMTCKLVAIATGQEFASYDCYTTKDKSDVPLWVQTLESTE